MKKYDIIKFDYRFGYIYDVIFYEGLGKDGRVKMRRYYLVRFSEPDEDGLINELLEENDVTFVGRIIRFKN